MTIWFVLLTLGAYLLGSLPVSYLAAKLLRGIDLRQYGTGQVGAGNLWRMTSSWKLSLPISLFDLGKGMVMIWVAKSVGLDIAQQLMVGLTVIIGHNWSVFLHFSGGRGVGTAMGVILLLPLLNNLTPWGIITSVTIIIVGVLIMRSSPVPVLAGLAAVPLVSWRLHEPLSLTLGFLAIFLIIVTKRLTAPRPADAVSISSRRLLLNRLLFDRDIMDRKFWMYREPRKADTTEQLPAQPEQKKGSR